MRVIQRLNELLDADEALAAQVAHADAIAEAQYMKRRREALANPRISPLQRARLTYGTRGLTVRELAAKAGVSPATVTRLEGGKRGAPESWAKLAIALGGVPPNRLGMQ